MSDLLYLDAFTQALKGAIAAVCPVAGVSVGDPAQASTWSFAPDPSATAAQVAAGQQAVASFVYAAPDPAVSGDAIVSLLSRAQAAQCDVRDLARIAWRDDVPATNAKLGRIAKALGTTPDALRQAAAASS